MKLPAFIYARPDTVEEALQHLAADEDSRVLAGGQSLLPMLAFRLAEPSVLVDVTKVAGLGEVVRGPGQLEIGATVTHRHLELKAQRGDLGPWSGVVAAAARHIGHVPIRTRGTFGGSVAHGESTAEWVILSLLLQGRVRLRSMSEERTLPVDEFCLGSYMTALRAGEMVLGVELSAPVGRTVFREIAPRHGDFATAVVAVSSDVPDGGDRTVLVVGGSGLAPFVLDEESTNALRDGFGRAALAAVAAEVRRRVEATGAAGSGYLARVLGRLVVAALQDLERQEGCDERQRF